MTGGIVRFEVRGVDDAFTGTVARIFRDRLMTRIKKYIREYGAVASGYLYDSFKSEVTGRGRKEAILRVWSDAEYAMYVETGTSRYTKMPPVEKIYAWVKLKFRGLSDEEAIGLAYRIAKSIKKKGTRPKRYLSSALNDAVAWLKRIECEVNIVFER